MKIETVSHVGFIVKNMERAIDFYHGVLGLELLDGPSDTFTNPNEGKAMGCHGDNVTHKHREAFLRTPDGLLLEFIEITDPVSVDIPLTAACNGKLHLCFYVDDIKEWVAHLAKYDVKPFLEPQPFTLGDGAVGYWVYFRDPDGILFELQEKH